MSDSKSQIHELYIMFITIVTGTYKSRRVSLVYAKEMSRNNTPRQIFHYCLLILVRNEREYVDNLLLWI